MTGWQQIYRSEPMPREEAIAVVKGQAPHAFPFTPDFKSMERVAGTDTWEVVAYVGPLNGEMKGH